MPSTPDAPPAGTPPAGLPPDGIFVSCVSRELHGDTAPGATPWPGSYRTALANYLGRCGQKAVFQEQFTQSGTGTLQKLATYIGRECKAVVHLIGRGAGAKPKADELAAFLAEHPDLLAARPGLRAALDAAPLDSLTYTQWEALLAIHFGRKLFVYAVDDAAPRAPTFAPDPDQARGQSGHQQRLRASGIHADPVGSVDQLLIELGPALIREGVVHRLPAPVRHNLPYRPLGRLFKGRGPFLRRIAESLGRSSSGAAITPAQAIHGAGGIGKTRAAVEYAWANEDRYDAMLFVVADAPEKVDAALASLAGVLEVAPADAKDDVRLASVLNWLRTHPRWLLILDNVDDPGARAAIQARLADLAHGHVLITSRLRDWPADVEALPLDLLAEQDAVAYLLDDAGSHRRHAPDDPAAAARVADALGRLSLGLTQARSYVSVKRTTYGDYLTRYQASDVKVQGWFDPALCHYPREVAVAWKTSVDQLSPPGRLLLDLLAWFGPEPVPESVLAELPADLTGALPDPREALLELNALSLAELEDTEPPTFWVHRLIQDVTRRRQLAEATPGTPPAALGQALSWLNRAFHGDTAHPDNWPRLRGLLPHAVAVATAADDRGLAASWLLNQTGTLAQYLGDYSAAEPLYRRALAGYERALGPDHPDTLLSVNNLAYLLQAKGDVAAAEPLYRRALAGYERALGPDHPDTLRSVNNLAYLLRAKGDVAAAEPLYRRALAGYERALGPDHPDTLLSVNNLAALLRAKSDVAAAEPLFRRAVAGLSALSRSIGRRLPNLVVVAENWMICMSELGVPPAEARRRLAEFGLEDLFDQANPQG